MEIFEHTTINHRLAPPIPKPIAGPFPDVRAQALLQIFRICFYDHVRELFPRYDELVHHF